MSLGGGGMTIANLELLERGAEGSGGVAVCDFGFVASVFLVGVCTMMVEFGSCSSSVRGCFGSTVIDEF